MKFIRKYSIVIICALVFLFACKSCQSCSRSRTLDFERTQTKHVVDSLNSIIRVLNADVQISNDSIKILNTEINALKEMNGMMQGSLDHARQTNNSLVRSINVKSQN